MAAITKKELKEAIELQTAERDKALSQANFHAGQIAAFKQMLEQVEAKEEGGSNDGEMSAAPTLRPISGSSLPTPKRRSKKDNGA